MRNVRLSVFQVGDITGADVYGAAPTEPILEHLVTDSRVIAFAPSSLFIALRGPQRNGHDFIMDAWTQGVRCFLVSELPPPAVLPEACFLLVRDTLQALQQLATWRRRQFHIPVIGITGSNGKTIVKEWLFQLLHQDYHIVRSPRSYNSQIGVPLSVWQMQADHELAIFEAGISRKGDMDTLAPMIDCSIGIFTMLGDAHSAGFADADEKLDEKLRLFNAAGIIFCSADNPHVLQKIRQQHKSVFCLGTHPDCQLQITTIKTGRLTEISAQFQGQLFDLILPFADKASIDNALLCCAVALHLGVPIPEIIRRVAQLEAVDMRMEVQEGIQGCTIINDSYSADLQSLAIALDTMQRLAAGRPTTLILSDMLDNIGDADRLYNAVADLICEKKVDRLYGIGEAVSALAHKLPGEIPLACYPSTAHFLADISTASFSGQIILIKGARQFCFEQIAAHFSRKAHLTTLEINVSALLHNLRSLQQSLRPGVRTMTMVKAAAYGSGSAEIARRLSMQPLSYLAVAYPDEGVELRQAGIRLPILVLNPGDTDFLTMIRYALEPEIFSLGQLRRLLSYTPHAVIHLKVETGMNRLGFADNDLPELCDFLQQYPGIIVQSIFSHLAAAENPDFDDFTHQQVARFVSACNIIEARLGYRPLRHILNSSGIRRFPQYQFDMVRMGIGLYGIGGIGEPVLTLSAVISQIKTLSAGDTVGYGRAGAAYPGMRIATVSIGYADGLPRLAGNGRYSLLIHQKAAPIVGRVCMDMCMVDITQIPEAREGDSVCIFGPQWPVEALAEACDTIPYEILTGIAGRVRRLYVED